jgi:predicted nucleic acid-binding protein
MNVHSYGKTVHLHRQNVVDSSGWLEYLANAANAAVFAPAIQDTAHLVVPVICLYEVFKRMAQQQGDEAALQAVGVLSLGQVVELSSELALQAAQLSIEHGLSMADSIILATARASDATLWTQDEHFEGLEGVRYVAKRI